MFKIPFKWLPASWGLSGNTRKIAEAEYYLSGYELDVQIVEIKHSDHNDDYDKEILKIKLKHKKIDQSEYDQEMARITYKIDSDYQIALLDIDLKNQKITQLEYEKKKAEILKEPWVSMPKISWDPELSHKTYFELDYNEYFIGFLKSNGYTGSEDDIINKWLNDVCISVIEEINDMDAEFITPSRRLDNTVQ